ncbi:MAG: MFS transporter [Spirochaetia bacterium]
MKTDTTRARLSGYPGHDGHGGHSGHSGHGGHSGYSRFLVVWAGQLLSGLGTGMTGFALGVHVFTETMSATSFAMVILCLFVPSIVLRPLGGVLADRFDRRMLIILGDLGSAMGVLFILFSLRTGDLSPARIYLGIALNSAFTALQNPAYKASLTDLVSEEQFAKAGGLVQLASSTQHLLAPLAAGFLLVHGGLHLVLMLDLATFGAAVAGALSIGARLGPAAGSEGSQRPNVGTELTEGRHTLTAHREVMSVVFVISGVTFFVGVLQTLFAPMMLTLTDARTLGVVQSLSASGMLITSLIIGVFGMPSGLKSRISVSLAATGIALALMGLSSNVAWITVTFFCFFACLPLVNTTAEVLIRAGIPNEMQGRAWGIIGVLSQLGYIAAYLSAGMLADMVFNPLLMPNGLLAASAGRIVGTGPGRGIALMLLLSGLGLVATAAARAAWNNPTAFLAERKGAYQS